MRPRCARDAPEMRPRCARDEPSPPPALVEKVCHFTSLHFTLLYAPQALVEKVCKDVTTRAKLSDETIGANTPADEDGNSLEGRGKQRSKSMARLKQEQQARVTTPIMNDQ